MEFREVRLTALLLGRHMELLRTTSSWVTKTFRKHGDRRQRVLPAPAPDTSSCQGSFAIIDLEKAPTRSSSCWKHIILLSYVRSIKSKILCLLRILWKLSRFSLTTLESTNSQVFVWILTVKRKVWNWTQFIARLIPCFQPSVLDRNFILSKYILVLLVPL